MKQQQSGFTLIELVMVIVILGILAATAVPKFTDLSDEAEKASLEATAGAVTSASLINYASCAAKGFPASSGGKCVAVTTCEEAGDLIEPALSDTKSRFTIDDAAAGSLANGDAFTCTITSKGKASITQEVKVTYSKLSA